MTGKRKFHSREFKIDAVKMIISGDRSMKDVAADPGARQGCLRHGA
ncbi:hypothetical protein ACFL2A_07375 [Thermodesulfobacteriota bacterium]